MAYWSLVNRIGNYVLAASVPRRKGFRICVQKQSDVLGHDFRCSYSTGTDNDFSVWACDCMLFSHYVNKQAG